MRLKGAKKNLIKLFCIVLTIMLFTTPFITVFTIGMATPAQYGATYYGELAAMYSNLKNTDGKKIVLIGNSNVALGIDSRLCEELLNASGLDYAVCNFGLYGALGTKMMLDLSKNHIGDGDIVVFTPEINAQSLSSYFSADEAWYALDSDMNMFWDFAVEDRGALVGGFFGYAAKKFDLYSKGVPAQSSGIYALSSFDERCDLKNYDRPYNVMPNGVDSNNLISLDTGILQKNFVEYVNDYYADILRKGAQMFYSFAPMNRAGIENLTEEGVSAFSNAVKESFDFPVMSDMHTYIMDSEWFYDSNFHLNESGMEVRTVNLVNDIKNQLKNTTKTEYVLPEKPIKPDASITGEGDNSCKDYFEYKQDGNYYIVIGLTEEGMEQSRLTIPYQVDGLYVKSFLPSVFAENTNIKEVTVQENIASVSDNSFDGCRNLNKLIFTHTEPSAISVGYGLLNGTNGKIYVRQSVLSQFKNDYFWGHYSNELNGY